MAENQYVLTQEGKESLLKRLDILLEEKTQALAELNFARSQGDLSENSDYDAAREKVEKIKGESEAITPRLSTPRKSILMSPLSPVVKSPSAA